MPPPPRRSDDRRPAPAPNRRDPFLSGMAPADDDVLDAEVLDADILDAEVLDADVLDAEVLDTDVLDAEVLDLPTASAKPGTAEVLELDDDPPAVFDLDALGGGSATAPTPSLPVYEPSAPPTGVDMLSLDVDPPPKPTRSASRPATATRPAVRITFVLPGEQSPFDGRG